jgi:serine-type D-Ala-D-Ala carboxypeptidase/endopeptidase
LILRFVVVAAVLVWVAGVVLPWGVPAAVPGLVLVIAVATMAGRAGWHRLRRLRPPGPDLAREVVVRTGAVGAATVLVEDGRVSYDAAGRSGRRGLSLDDDTRFELGSVTKLFTGLALADLVVRGVVGLDDPVTRYLPVEFPDEVTLRALATHTSGLPRLPRSRRLWLRAVIAHPDPYAFLDRATLFGTLPGTPLSGTGMFRYSNLGYELLGEAVAAAAGTDWWTLVRRRICEPLGMTSTSPAANDRTAHGHDHLGFRTPYWTFPVTPAAGGLYSTAADLRRFLQAQLNPDASPLAAAIHLSRRPHAGDDVGLGWMLRTRDGSVIAWHNGGTGGFGAMLALQTVYNDSDPATEPQGAGIAVLTNSAHTPQLDRLILATLAHR